MTIKLALLGTWHVHAIHHLQDSRANPQAEIVVVWDSNTDRGKTFAAEHDLPFEPDLANVLARDDISAVVVDTATVEHPAVIGAALDAGKHVFTEKVLALETADAEHLVEKARANGLVLRVSLQRLREAPIQTIKVLLDAGAIGTVTSSRIRYAHHGAVGTPWIPAHFFNAAEAGGGAIIDLGAHGFYLGMYLHGTRPLSIQTLLTEVSNVGVEDNTVSILAYPDGVLAVAETSFVAGFFGYAIEIAGTDGSIVVGPADHRVLLRKAGTDSWLEQEQAAALPATLDQFIEIIAGAPEDPEHLETSIWLTRIAESAYRSARTGERVAF
ncbi:MAG: Gfo/Idh/MocA family oxidoreductase [Devosia sp.]|uniref:Gfo/Idh/MocA family protein n=1 Tax=Devosia sp. TaxID=1871048 RepID=UPI0033996F8D